MKVIISIFFISYCCPLFAAQDTPNSLALRWIKAVNSKSYSEFSKLIHPSCPSNRLNKKFIKNMSSGIIPRSLIKIKVMPINVNLLSQSLRFFVTPLKELRVKILYKSSSDRKEYGLGRAAYIGKENQKWYIIPCVEILRKDKSRLTGITLTKLESKDWKWEWVINLTNKKLQEFKIIAKQGKREKVLVSNQEIQPSTRQMVSFIFRIDNTPIHTSKGSSSISYGFTRKGESPYGFSNWLKLENTLKVNLTPSVLFNLKESRIRLLIIDNSDDDLKMEIFLLRE